MLPDFSAHGYRAEALLGANEEGGCLTYRAVASEGGAAVVIKRFAFAASDASWDGYRAHEREIQVLRELQHPRIPAYIDAFATDDGFCLVQAALEAPSLDERMSFEPREIKRIAASVLEILVYLQDRLPPVIHRDLKPSNILVDAQGQAYLVDFGLASTERKRSSTIATGTPGFMPPEQMLGRALGSSADLFGLGATLIAMLSSTRSEDVSELLGVTNTFDLSVLPATLSDEFRAWLERMVAPDPAARHADARAALEALEPLAITRQAARPSTTFSSSSSAPSSKPAPTPAPASTPAPAAVEHAGPSFGRWVLVLAVVFVLGVFAYDRMVERATLGELEEQEREMLEQREERARAEAAKKARALEEEKRRVLEALEAAERRGKTILCQDERMQLRDVDIDFEEADAIHAQRGCELTISGGRVRAPTLLTVAGDARVSLEGVSLEATGEGVAVSVRGSDATLSLVDTEVRARDVAVEVAAHGLQLTRSTLTAATALRVSSSAEVEVEDATIDGKLEIEEGGWVFGLDPSADARRRRELRHRRYAGAACVNTLSCYRDNGVDARIELEVQTKLDASGQPTKVKLSSKGALPKVVRACLRDGAARAIEDYDEADGAGLLTCTIDATLSGFMTSVRSQRGSYARTSSCLLRGDACADGGACCEDLACVEGSCEPAPDEALGG